MSQPHPPSTTSPDRKPLAVRRRADLRAVQTRHKYQAAIVVKDPVALTYHRLRPDEYFVLEQLDGRSSLQQIRENYQREFAPRKVTPTDLNQLLFRFHQSGLTVSDAPLQGDRLVDRRRADRRQRWMEYLNGILFIRFPGVDPEPLLRRIYPLARPLLSRLALSGGLLFCLAAIVQFATRWQSFVSEFPKMNHWIEFQSVLILAAVIGCTKILHELGHAVVCRHLGGECHQIGPMLLVFTPALYCDTSDSWMLPNRWQRAAVGIAGVATEILLAAIATFVWSATAPGMVHYVAMNVMLVCSVSTVLFNANPLLRFDGYYVLSDICDTPNLSEQSRRLLAGHFNQLVFGVNETPAEPLMTRWARFWMLSYAVAAICYRWALTLTILWFVSLVLRPYGLESLGWLLCVLAAGGLVFTLARGPVHFFRNPARRKQIRMPRALISTIVLAGIVAVAWCPFPSGVSQSARLVPRHETPVYVKTAGLLKNVHAYPGATVIAGTPIATLINPEVELQYVTIQGRYETQQLIIESIRRSAFDTPEAANMLPAQEALLEDLGNQLKIHAARLDGLTIRAPSSGTLIAAPRRPTPKDPVAGNTLVSWSGYATDDQNQNCFLEAGTELMSVVEDKCWDAEITLEQAQLDRIAIGSRVKLALEAMPGRTFTGTVTELSRSQWDLDQHAQRRDDRPTPRMQQPASTSYLVRVELDDSDERWIAGATAAARIEAKPISLVGRTTRLLHRLFRFRS